jgi:uncharacterized protein YbaP (TraB family)
MIRTNFKVFSMGLASMVCACVTGTPAQSAAAPVPHPALWKIADKDTNIYLFGTIHLLPPDTQWRTPAFDQALAGSDVLVVEVLLPKDPAAIAQVMVKLGMSPGLPPLVERVPAEKREALRAAIAASGYPQEMFDQMESWAAAITLTSVLLVKMGFDPELGVEKQLTRGYEQAQKPVMGLESAEEQLGFFDHLSEEAQRTFLVSAIDDPEGTRAEFAAMLKAWLEGNVKDIARSFDNETMLSDELRDALMRKRNSAWADWVAKRLDQPGTVFVAVGAGHLAGEDSLLRLLKAKGLRAKRIQ